MISVTATCNVKAKAAACHAPPNRIDARRGPAGERE